MTMLNSYTKICYLIIIAICLFIASIFKSCNISDTYSAINIPIQVSVTPQVETDPVPRDSSADAADDPAIWINSSQPDSSLIIGTDKMGGLAVYDLSGKQLFYYDSGKMNNADLRYGFQMVSGSVDILAVSNRSENSIDLFKINRNGSLEIIHRNRLHSQMSSEVYGLCMYRNRFSGKFYVFVNGLDGEIEQWELFVEDGKINGKIMRKLKLETQVEGMVADDETGILYVGEEDKGIWKFNADPDEKELKVLIPSSSCEYNKLIISDIEGLAIFKVQNGFGYLIASVQGNDSYAVFERKSPNKFIGSFKIVGGLNVDGAEVTDGIDVCDRPLGRLFPHGLLVVQDGKNFESGKPAAQNFKFIRWDSIATKFKPALKF